MSIALQADSSLPQGYILIDGTAAATVRQDGTIVAPTLSATSISNLSLNTISLTATSLNTSVIRTTTLSATSLTSNTLSSINVFATNTLNPSAALTSNLLGVSRASGTTYTNNTGRILVVYVNGVNTPSNGICTVNINGVQVMALNGYGNYWGGSFIVPSGATYSATNNGCTLQGWFEF